MADAGARPEIVAVITTNRESTGGGGVPIFFVQTEEEMERIGLQLARPMRAVAAQLSPEVSVLIHHP